MSEWRCHLSLRILKDDIFSESACVVRRLGASLAIISYRTLKILAHTITVVGHIHDPLCGLCFELILIAGNNVLEELGLNIVVAEDASCRTKYDDWSSFVSVLTESGVFPMLGKICWYSVQDAVLESLGFVQLLFFLLN